MKKIIEKLLKKTNFKKAARLEVGKEHDLFVREAGEQIRELAKRGLGIPVFTL